MSARETKQSGRRPDESMSLINDLFAHPLDDGYYAAARKRAAGGGPTSTGWMPRRSVGLLIGLGLLGLLLTTAALQVEQDAVVVSAERTALIDSITEESARTEELEQQVAELSDEVIEIETRLLTSTFAGGELSETLAQVQGASGTGRVTGPGVIVTLTDAPREAGEPVSITSKVLDVDLRVVANGLWAAGAEAVSINGERITPVTSIRRASDVMLVNVRPIGPPYEVLAIGDPRTLPTAFVDGPAGTWLRDNNAREGMPYSVSTSESLTLPGGTVSLDYAQPQEDS